MEKKLNTFAPYQISLMCDDNERAKGLADFINNHPFKLNFDLYTIYSAESHGRCVTIEFENEGNGSFLDNMLTDLQCAYNDFVATH